MNHIEIKSSSKVVIGRIRGMTDGLRRKGEDVKREVIPLGDKTTETLEKIVVPEHTHEIGGSRFRGCAGSHEPLAVDAGLFDLGANP